jgi:hypothetical protein
MNTLRRASSASPIVRCAAADSTPAATSSAADAALRVGRSIETEGALAPGAYTTVIRAPPRPMLSGSAHSTKGCSPTRCVPAACKSRSTAVATAAGDENQNGLGPSAPPRPTSTRPEGATSTEVTSLSSSASSIGPAPTSSATTSRVTRSAVTPAGSGSRPRDKLSTTARARCRVLLSAS